MTSGPTVPPPAPDSLNSSLKRNIEALRQRRQNEQASEGLEERLARAIARFAGSMQFIYLHVLLYGGWLIVNSRLVPRIAPWDPTLVMLAMIASVEAIFLSTFILITQNRMAAAADRRAELDVQVSLLAEQEITMLVEMVADIAARMGVLRGSEPEVEEMKRGVAPEAVLDAIERTEEEAR